MHLCLICKGYTKYVEMEQDLQPSVAHQHGRVGYQNLAFEVQCVYQGHASFACGIYTMWPGRLSIATEDDRISAYLGYGRSKVQKISVAGLGKNLRPEESTYQLCSLTVSGSR